MIILHLNNLSLNELAIVKLPHFSVQLSFRCYEKYFLHQNTFFGWISSKVSTMFYVFVSSPVYIENFQLCHVDFQRKPSFVCGRTATVSVSWKLVSTQNFSNTSSYMPTPTTRFAKYSKLVIARLHCYRFVHVTICCYAFMNWSMMYKST